MTNLIYRALSFAVNNTLSNQKVIIVDQLLSALDRVYLLDKGAKSECNTECKKINMYVLSRHRMRRSGFAMFKTISSTAGRRSHTKLGTGFRR